MTKRKTIGHFIAMGIFVLFALFFFSLVGYDFSAYICLGIALVIALFYLFQKYPSHATKWLRRILVICLAVGIVLACVTGYFIATAASTDSDCEYIIVLGAAVHGNVPSLSLRERMDAAYEYLQTHPDTICVVSGGQGNGENITEAACMYDYLTKKGIAPERIWMEDKATSTWENIAFSLDLIEEKTGIRPKTAGIVSSEYHIFRAGLIAKSQNLNSAGIPAATTWLSLRVNYFLREIVAVWYYILLGG